MSFIASSPIENHVKIEKSYTVIPGTFLGQTKPMGGHDLPLLVEIGFNKSENLNKAAVLSVLPLITLLNTLTEVVHFEDMGQLGSRFLRKN